MTPENHQSEELTISKAELVTLKFFSLSNYRQIRTPFVFIDESGSLHNKADYYFGIGSFKTHRSPTLYKILRSVRDRFNYRVELKFKKLSKISLGPAKAFLTAAIGSQSGAFKCVIIPKNDPVFDIEKYFANDPVNVYKKFLVYLLKRNINEIDIITVLADDYFTPFSADLVDIFEGGVRALINSHLKRLAITGIHQVCSHSTDLIQLVDLILGCVMFDLKSHTGIIDLSKPTKSQLIKLELVNHLKDLINMPRTDYFFSKDGSERKRFAPRSGKFECLMFVPKEEFQINESGPPSNETEPA